MDELNRALTDYYNPRTDLVRKQHLHEQLNRFLVDRHSWQVALTSLQQDRSAADVSPFSIFFLLQVLEHSIRHRYGDQPQIRQILLSLLLHRFDALPAHVRSKLSLLIVQMARCDEQWSTEEYFQICFHLIETQPSAGLLLLTSTVEELGQFNEDCPMKRCHQLKAALNQNVAHVVSILHMLLKRENKELQGTPLIKQQVLICLDRLINRLSVLPLPVDLVDDLFHYALSTWSTDALNCIHELILKQHVPRPYDAILHATLHHMVQFLLLANQNTIAPHLTNKLTEILRSMFSLHLKRCESTDQFPMLDLLTGVYHFTLQQTTQDGFYACLDIWSTFIDYINVKDENRMMHRDNTVDKYSQVLRSLSQELLQRIHRGYAMAGNLEETTELNDSETAANQYVRECADLLVKVAEITVLSSSVLHALIDLLQPDMDKYRSIQKLLQVSPHDPTRQLLSLNTESIQVCHQLLSSLSHLLYGFSRVATTCLLDDNHHQQSQFQTRLTLVHQFIQFMIYTIHMRYDLIDCSIEQLHNDFSQVQTRSFECVTNLSPWLSQMLSSHTVSPENRRLVQELITNIIDHCAPLIDADNPNKAIALVSGSLLSSLVPLTRAHLPIDQMNSIRQLTQRILTWTVASNSNANFQLYKSGINIVSSLVLIESQSAEQFFRTIFQPLQAILHQPASLLNAGPGQQNSRSTFLNYTKLLAELIESIRSENHKTRQTLFLSIQTLIVDLNGLLPAIINRDTECETALISLLLMIFEILRAQMGAELVHNILQTTFAAFNMENVRNVLREAKPNAHSAVSRFLEFLSLLVNEPGNNKLTQQFLPMIIDLCTSTLYPTIRENFALDIREHYYKLLHNLLLNNWRYFFKGNVLTTLNGEVETTANENSFVQLMESIAWSFSQADIEQFRVNLTSCNELQLKCGLYTKLIFRQQMSQALLSLLLTVLLVRSHELCRDDIISTLFHILTNASATNFVQSIQHHLEQSSTQAPLSDQHKRLLLENYGRNETDLPSFTQNLNDFIHDYRHYTTIDAA